MDPDPDSLDLDLDSDIDDPSLMTTRERRLVMPRERRLVMPSGRTSHSRQLAIYSVSNMQAETYFVRILRRT